MSTKPKNKFFILIGPAGAGKSSIAVRLLETYPENLRLSISTTSRSPRPGEVDGEHYSFITREQFESEIANDSFFEWEETHGNYYGTPQEQIDYVTNDKGSLLLDIDVRGAKSFLEKFGDQVEVVLVLPPHGDTMISRVEGRGGLQPGELKIRLHTAIREIEDFRIGLEKGIIEYVVINNTLEESHREVCSIFSNQKEDISQEEVKEGLQHLDLLAEQIKEKNG